MQIMFVPPNRTVISGSTSGKFLRMSGPDAIVELKDGRRVMWSGATEVELLPDSVEIQENTLPKLEAELARLEHFSRGKYAMLGITVDTECVELPKQMHSVFVTAALGEQPPDAILCRRCSSKGCVRADHLFWGTRSDCQRDMVLRGLARPSGKQVTAVELVERILSLRERISRLRERV